MRLELSRFVESELDDIANYIAQDNPRRAVSFIQEIRATFHEIRHNPLLYQLRHDIGDEARMTTVGSYAILFRVTGDIVRIQPWYTARPGSVWNSRELRNVGRGESLADGINTGHHFMQGGAEEAERGEWREAAGELGLPA